MRIWVVLPAVLLVSACGPGDPREARIDNIEDVAEAQADALEDAAANEAGVLLTDAEMLDAQAATVNGFEAARIKARAHALREEAKLVKQQGEARARAARDKARAEVSAIRAE